MKALSNFRNTLSATLGAKLRQARARSKRVSHAVQAGHRESFLVFFPGQEVDHLGHGVGADPILTTCAD